jgi:hypothetical protein
MWAQEWNNIYDLVIPFKNKASVDVTPTMVTQVANGIVSPSTGFNKKHILILYLFTNLPP